MNPLIDSLRGNLIVSCQALEHEPLHGAVYMSAMARAAAIGGAGGIRANGTTDIAAIRATVDLPIIGINKRKIDGFDVFITPDYADAQAIVRAGAAVVALDGTPGARPGGETLADIIRRIHDTLNVPVMADISCVEDADYADVAGADIIATTLSGYTRHGRPAIPGPDLELISLLKARTDRPVIAEGRFSTPEHIAEAFERGVWAVVVGGAITRPQEITARFAAALPKNVRATSA